MILEILKKRRSHFRKEFTGASIPDTVIDYLVECAHQAPSHKLTYPWRFLVFKGTSLLDLSEKMLEIYLKNTPAISVNEMQVEKIKQMPNEVSHAIAICMKRDEAKRVPEIEEVCAVACAVQNMYLGLIDYPNVGGYWTTGNGTFSPEMHEFLGLGTEDRCLGFFLIGEVISKRFDASRPNFKQFVDWKS